MIYLIMYLSVGLGFYLGSLDIISHVGEIFPAWIQVVVSVWAVIAWPLLVYNIHFNKEKN